MKFENGKIYMIYHQVSRYVPCLINGEYLEFSDRNGGITKISKYDNEEYLMTLDKRDLSNNSSYDLEFLEERAILIRKQIFYDEVLE